ncbi:kelch repeat-containing protein [Paucibacter sp. APW11]|uniref:Kelch repeat-containing protein n=1 Tax=Roseateles aquae TaxID=3077235 RepID=A0ABU3PFJ3_9BURK|nr:kelch repeat-containing protein [Paucibacter sp. APW11]MDT9001360.1 kelch repeat-containing protein [Paucibacter sp. APW11]
MNQSKFLLHRLTQSVIAIALLSAGAVQAATSPAQPSEEANSLAVPALAAIRLQVARSDGHTVTKLSDGRLLVLGGRSDNAATAAAELIDPSTGRVELLNPMLQPRHGHTATLLPDGRVLVAGGDLADGRVLALNSAELYDPKAKLFQALQAPLSIERAYHTATLLKNGKVLLAGGQGLRPGMITFSAELFDPASGKFEPLTPQRLLAPRTYHAATLLDSGQVLIVGGTDWQTPRAPNSAELFDPQSNTFSAVDAALTFKNEMPQLLKLKSGRVMVLGNQGAEIFDPLTKTFKVIQGPLKPRAYAAATALSDGGAVVLGGISGDSFTAWIERYSPSRGSFRPVGSLPKARAWGVAAQSNGGTVFVIGGVDSADAAITDVAVYRP